MSLHNRDLRLWAEYMFVEKLKDFGYTVLVSRDKAADGYSVISCFFADARVKIFINNLEASQSADFDLSSPAHAKYLEFQALGFDVELLQSEQRLKRIMQNLIGEENKKIPRVNLILKKH
jgi:hypothetical protein